MSAKQTLTLIVTVLLTNVSNASSGVARDNGVANDFAAYEWTEITGAAEWTPRAGLQVVLHRDSIYLMGGRTPRPPSFPPVPGDSDIWGDVWKSEDGGATWKLLLATDDSNHWPARAYFRAVQKDAYMYVLGGQNFQLISNPDPSGPPFLSFSDFFNDVWRSKNGIEWEQVTEAAAWAGRAGLSSVVFKGHLYVMGGSFNDDPAVIGGPPTRVYFNDVWRSRDGRQWEQVTNEAPWAARAGAILVVKNGFMYLLGGEDGFTCIEGSRCPPYYNDVWRTRDGRNWELVTDAADWPPRPGHQALVIYDIFVLFGGFGLSTDPTNPFEPANPMDVWISKDGFSWEQVSDSPWNAVSPAEIKYDFAAVVAPGGEKGPTPTILTFGGDRETFDFTDPMNYLNVDNDVWSFAAPLPGQQAERADTATPATARLHPAVPNPFNPLTTVSLELSRPGSVSLRIYDVVGRHVKTLVDQELLAGLHSFVWDGVDKRGQPAASGVYLCRLRAGDTRLVQRLVLIK